MVSPQVSQGAEGRLGDVHLYDEVSRHLPRRPQRPGGGGGGL